MKRSNLTICIVFTAILAVLTLASILNPVRERSETENRTLAQMPEFSAKTVFDGSFTKGYEDFVTDQFVARDFWINLKVNTERALGRTEINDVYLGSDGYFFERKTESDIDEDQVAYNLDCYRKFVDGLTEQGINAYVTLAPISVMINEDKLPFLADEYDFDRICDAAVRELDERFIELRPVLRMHSDEYLYYRTDHHWTSDGAYYAYRAIAEKFGFTPLEKSEFTTLDVTDNFFGTVIARLNIKTEPDTIKRYDPKDTKLGGITITYNMTDTVKDTFYDESKLTVYDKYAYFLGGNDPYLEITTGADSGRVLFLVKDSYANCLIPFLACHFDKIYVVDLRYFNAHTISFISNSCTDVTDALALYNVSGFAQDRYLIKLAD